MAFNYFREKSDLTLKDFDLCPFCGKNIIVERDDGVLLENWSGDILGVWSIECEECDTSLEPFVTPTHAFLVWNNRMSKTEREEK